MGKYDVLKKKLSKIDFIAIGSINTLPIKCGNKKCDCYTTNIGKHGYYTNWTRKISGKTKSKVLSKKQVELVKEFKDNYLQLKNILDQMLSLSEEYIRITK